MVHTQIGKDIDYAASLLRSGEIVAIPTETVYGLAGNAFSEQAVKKIYAIKNRPLHNPLIVHLAEKSFLDRIAINIPSTAFLLLEKFSPGPLTILLEKKESIPGIVTSGLPHVAVRFPSHPMTIELLRLLDFPLAAPSANPFGYISPTRAEHVMKQLGGKIPYILDGGICDKGIESTVVGFQGEVPVVHRLGAISLEDIRHLIPGTITKTREEHQPVSPGMLLHHYSPSTKTILTDDLESAIKQAGNKKAGVISFRRTIHNIPNDHQYTLSSSGDLEEAARNLYDALHQLDALQLDLIIVEKVPDEGIGKAINDRLERAAARR